MGFLRPAFLRSRVGVAVILSVALQSLSFIEGVLPASAQVGQTPSEPNRPAYQLRRFDEDWSVLRGVDLGKTDDFFDRLKFIPLTPDQSVWLSLGGQVRESARSTTVSPCSATRSPSNPMPTSSPGFG
jgi:hypothetical protein